MALGPCKPAFSKALCAVLAAWLVSGCATAGDGTIGQIGSAGLVAELREPGVQDPYGRPKLGRPLEAAPTEPGSVYTVVARDKSGVVRTSYLVAVLGRTPDAGKPFETFFEWTEKGFRAAGEFVKGMFSSDVHFNDDDAATAFLVITAAGATVMIAGGMVIGVADGTWEAGKEIAKLFGEGDVVASFTTYEYDGEGRLTRTRAWFPGEPPEEIIRSTFYYENPAMEPSRAVVESVPDKAIHERYFQDR